VKKRGKDREERGKDSEEKREG
jgi:hypothetical protein